MLLWISVVATGYTLRVPYINVPRSCTTADCCADSADAVLSSDPYGSLDPRFWPLMEHPALGPLVSAAGRAVSESTGAGEESSGSGRPEWGTWCDSDLFSDVRQALNRLELMTSEQGAWPKLWAVAGGEAPNATIRVAGGAQFDVLLRLFASPAGISDEERCCEVKYVDGVLSLLLPVLGQLTISKLRADGDILGVPKSLKQGDRAFLQLGGPPQRYIATSSTAALLEVVLRHSTQETTLSSSLPELTSDEASDGFASLVGVFQDKDAKAHDAPPVPPARAGWSSSRQ